MGSGDCIPEGVTYNTIQKGVNACPEGGTVTVSSGTYTEAIYINKSISLIGNGTPTITSKTLGNTNTVTFDGENTNNALISGFIITGAEGTSSAGIYCGSSSPTITNNIITENGTTSSWSYGIRVYSGKPSIDYNCVWGNGSGNKNYYHCSRGAHDISQNPQFVGKGDFHLGSSSSCIDKGSNRAPKLSLKDKDGKPRIVNGIVDMGAYEYPISIKEQP